MFELKFAVPMKKNPQVVQVQFFSFVNRLHGDDIPRDMTYCIIMSGRLILGSGIGVRNPQDEKDRLIGEREAFRRAAKAAAYTLVDLLPVTFENYVRLGVNARKIYLSLWSAYRLYLFQENDPERYDEVMKIIADREKKRAEKEQAKNSVFGNDGDGEDSFPF